MKKTVWALAGLLALGALVAGCSGEKKEAAQSSDKKVVLKVGATPVPHAEILNEIKPLLAKDGIDLQIIEFTDYVKPNLSLNDKEIDANFFQHEPYLKKFAADRKLDLVNLVAVHIEPMGVYSKKLKDIKSVPDGAKVAIPNDPTNGGRALNILAKAGLIKLRMASAFRQRSGISWKIRRTSRSPKQKLRCCPAPWMMWTLPSSIPTSQWKLS